MIDPRIWILLGVWLFGVAAGAGVNGWRLHAKYLGERQDQQAQAQADYDAALARASAERRRIADASAKNADKLAALENANRKRRNEYDALPPSPVPADCRLSPERLRNISEAISAANRATTDTGAPTPSLPGDQPAEKRQP